MHPRPQALTPETLLRAYATGIFPMAENADSAEIFWVDPRRRGILPLDGLHISRSLARTIRRGGYDVVLDGDFAGVVRACADRDETWINATIHALYLALHDRGHAHSLEIRQDGALAGGVFGITLGGAFFGESMFSYRRDASKLALAHLTAHLRRCGFSLFDVQFVTPHLTSLGAREIPRAAYHELLSAALARNADFLSRPPPGGHEILQDNTQTS